MYEGCNLYGVQRKKQLKYLLGIENKNLDDLINNYNVFLNNGKRLVETPRSNLNDIHRRIKRYLKKIDMPDWVKSQKGYSYVDNGLYHKDNPYILTLDLKSFFPNSHREFIYTFYKSKLKMSNDVSKIMSDLTTINLNTYNYNNLKTKTTIEDFINKKGIQCLNHIPTGSPISTYLSYFAFSDMFEEIKQLLNNNMKMSLYVDDLTISSDSFINRKIISDIENILIKYRHKLSYNKVKLYNKNSTKKITGTILSKDRSIKIPNKLHNKIYKQFLHFNETEYLSNEEKENDRKKLYGSILAARQIIPNCYGYIYGISKKPIK